MNHLLNRYLAPFLIMYCFMFNFLLTTNYGFIHPSIYFVPNIIVKSCMAILAVVLPVAMDCDANTYSDYSRCNISTK